MEELEFVRITDPNVFRFIPHYLFEQIKNREYDIEQIYKYGPIFVCSRLNCFYAIVDDKNIFKGILWLTVDPVVEQIAVNVLSVDRQYQFNGILRKAKDFIKKLPENDNIFAQMLKELDIKLKDKIMWPTKRPRAFERIGAKQSERVIMEI